MITKKLALALFVFGVFAQHPDHAFAPNHFALVTNFLNRCSNLHVGSSS
jgi:hypothetical protein